MTLAAAVLAGGRSSRMGRTKALIHVDGRAMADRVIDAARSVGADPVVVIGGDPTELAGLSAPVTPDLHPGGGPVAGVLGALTHFDGVADRVLVLPCDLARVDASTLLPLLEAEAGDGFSKVWVAAGDRLEPLCAIWSVDAAARVRQLFDSGERALHRVIGELPHVAVTVDPGGLVNVNTPNDIPR
ncbi:MAG: molybdenum cofactor guanylyltransferase [Ilumatobacter sp.]|uniref:molybdenum cofactor guanylyltransferase n=1 Tax=Ilumatobacter sp. TaxID=1967498 RepID=UPI003298F2E9